MSAIYGFTHHSKLSTSASDTIEAMEYWNRIYGSVAADRKCYGSSALGCCVDHFSDEIPCSEPILNYRRGVAVVDALIFNRTELASHLPDIQVETLSDETLLLALIERKGFEFLSNVNGDFAGAIYDPEISEWTLFRDHLGIRPLHYYLDDNLFAFSTDFRGLAAISDADFRWNEELLYSRLTGGLMLDPIMTEFDKVRCIPPASVVHIKSDGSAFIKREHLYWKLGNRKIRFRKDEQYQQELYRLVKDSVERRCDAVSGILGAELSGGLDSTVIDILINRHGREGRYYSWSYDPEFLPIIDPNDERKLVLDVCEQEGITCRFRLPSDRLEKHYTNITLMPPMTNTKTISYGSAWLKSQGANVVFSGHGGDEGISHRASRYELFHNREYYPYFKLFWQDTKGKKFRLLRTLKWAAANVKSGSEYNTDSSESLSFYEQFLNPDFANRMRGTRDMRPLTFNYSPVLHIMSGGYRPRLDTCAFQGALNGVRYLFPFLDYRVVDFAVSIPRRLYIDHTGNRVIYRKAFHDLLPESMRGEIRKATVSLRSATDKISYEDAFLYEKNSLLHRLDRECWSGILNFDAIEALTTNSDELEHTRYMLDRFFSVLWKLLLIQSFHKDAQNWRKHDEQEKKI